MGPYLYIYIYICVNIEGRGVYSKQTMIVPLCHLNSLCSIINYHIVIICYSIMTNNF